MSALDHLPAEARGELLMWAFAFSLTGFLFCAVVWAWYDYQAQKGHRKGKGRYKLPCHAWLAVLPMVSPAWLLPALLALGAVLVVGLGRGLKAEMGKVERRDGDGDGALGAMRPTHNPGALRTTRPTLYFTGGDPL